VSEESDANTPLSASCPVWTPSDKLEYSAVCHKYPTSGARYIYYTYKYMTGNVVGIREKKIVYRLLVGNRRERDQ
jgi:hypothetical protein